MSYIKNKLSVEDKDILNDIFDELENINIPTTFKTNPSNGPKNPAAVHLLKVLIFKIKT